MKQLKQQYRERIKYQRQHLLDLYPSVRSGTHKHFSTKQEKSYYFLHKIECREYPVKQRATRGRALANPWDDYPSYVYGLAKSWKYNSKRQNQYYR
ncbi:hypothetical protein AB4440_24235 [Vibrio splendidus]|uniref:hypothetical protein n=3 Tax=Vibrio splendidus TaxID=29497 RepID=UPI000C81CE8E|nr:hypothetical protein [Vibrio splendidus]PMP01918.1 hypothetical protein BCS97_23870 [Vibrio splendidus]PMP36989.1 hypothetical protein BCS87_02595 [Vibrio splendidus]PMP54418.1 hypothetical protein BCS85_22585 [Vibrio splendidus]PMP55253.1 hypothetical protein BCS83_14415 [Vibrio splendidus]